MAGGPKTLWRRWGGLRPLFVLDGGDKFLEKIIPLRRHFISPLYFLFSIDIFPRSGGFRELADQWRLDSIISGEVVVERVRRVGVLQVMKHQPKKSPRTISGG